MLDRIHTFVGRLATWPAVAMLFIGYVLCDLGFGARTDRLGSDPPLLDLRWWYTPGDVQTLFEKLGPADRNFYALTEVTLDLAFPFIYGTLLAIFIYRLFGLKLARVLLLVPLLGMAADLLENAGVAFVGWTYDGSTPGLAALTTVFTLIKGVLVRLAMVVVLIGGVCGLVKRCRGAIGAEAG